MVPAPLGIRMPAGISTSISAVRRTTRGQRVRALLLVAPLLALLLLSFCLPIGILLSQAVYDPATHDALPRTASALAASPGNGVPDDAVFAALDAAGAADFELHRDPSPPAEREWL